MTKKPSAFKKAMDAVAPKKPRSASEAEIALTAEEEEAKAILKDENLKDTKVRSGDYVIYVSRKPESAQFTIRAGGKEVKSIRDRSERRIIFRVPPEVHDSFKKHPYVVSGRLIKAADAKE